MDKLFSRDISGAIDRFLHNDDWRFSFDENRGVFRFGLGLKGKMKTLDYIIDVKKDAFITYAVSPLSADADDQQMMAQMAEFLIMLENLPSITYPYCKLRFFFS